MIFMYHILIYIYITHCSLFTTTLHTEAYLGSLFTEYLPYLLPTSVFYEAKLVFCVHVKYMQLCSYLKQGAFC